MNAALNDMILDMLRRLPAPDGGADIVSRGMVSDIFLADGKAFFSLTVPASEAERFPALAREYYEAGPLLLRQQLVRYLRQCVERGELRIPDLDLAADQLIELASVSIHDRALFLGSGAVDKDILRKVNSAAVQMFLAYYGGAKTAYAMAAE